jgi:cytochrome c biogenesis protein
MEKGKNKSIIDLVWDLFASVKLAVVIFSLIALTSMIGTVLEQDAEPEKNIQILVKMFGVGHETAHSIYNVFDKLGFMNMYHSWWFVTFLLLFAANLIICSLDRLPRILKLVRENVRPLSLEHIGKMSIRKSFAIKGGASAIKDKVASSINKIGFKPSEAAAENGLQFYAEKGNFTRLGVYITHLSILIILAGAIIGLKFGFNGTLNLPEGQTAPVAFKDRGTQVPLGFEIRCDNFDVEYYGDSDMPKSYRSWLTVLKDGREMLKKVISVNDPLTYEGITFYQSSYGAVGENMQNGVIVLRVISSDGKSSQVNTKIGGTFTIPGSSVEGHVSNFSPSLSFDQSGRPFTYDAGMKNPAIFVELPNVGGKPYSGWILKRYPQTWRLPDGSSVEFLDYWGVEYTGLQVRKDPGVWIVYLGCIIMAAGLYITFFMSHKRLWVNVAHEKGAAKIVIGASANRNRAAFERNIEKLAGLLGEATKGENR